MNNRKAFISYSWSSPRHCDLIREYGERLINDGVDIVLDQWDLSEGQDKNAFMEKMVSDKTVTHVLIFSDRKYAQKSDERKAGVGTESQIISKEVYEKVDQKKFIPVVCEKDEKGEPYLPVFLRSRMYIDFSTPQAVNESWEKLLRAIYDKPIHEKPALGKAPSFLEEEEGRPSLPTIGKFGSLREALLNSKPTVGLSRRDFVDAAMAFADGFRVRKQPSGEPFDEQVLRDLHKLLPLRDQLVDWLLLEGTLDGSEQLDNILADFLEKLLALRGRPPELTSWNEQWFDAVGIFVYEMFLYVIAVLIRTERFSNINNVLRSHFLLPEAERGRGTDFESFRGFWIYSKSLGRRNDRLKLNRMSVLADTLNERCTRSDISFRDIMQAELVLFLVSQLSDVESWYPQTLVFAESGGGFPLFVRAAQHKYFARLEAITGVASGEELRRKFKEGCEKHNSMRQLAMMMGFADMSVINALNLAALDTIT